MAAFDPWRTLIAMPTRFRDWHRLFFLIGTVWLAVPALHVWESYPRERQYIDAMVQSEISSYSYRDCYRGFKDCVGGELPAEPQLSEIRRRAEAKARERLPARRKETINTAIALWLGAMIPVYLVGLFFTWLRRGFRAHSRNSGISAATIADPKRHPGWTLLALSLMCAVYWFVAYMRDLVGSFLLVYYEEAAGMGVILAAAFLILAARSWGRFAAGAGAMVLNMVLVYCTAAPLSSMRTVIL